jgi:hypothetical protein
MTDIRLLSKADLDAINERARAWKEQQIKVAQPLEPRSPKPQVESSTPSATANPVQLDFDGF